MSSNNGNLENAQKQVAYIIDEEDKYVIDPIYDYIGARGCWCYEKQY